MWSKLQILLLPLLLLGLMVPLAGCPPVNDDDSSDDDDSPGDSALCSGPGCMNGADCPADEPAAGDPCTFNDNCHYCADGSDEAQGYTCDGTSFTYQGDYVCNP